MNNNIDQIMRRTRGYWYEDGFAEITIGAFFALIGLAFYIQSQIDTGSVLYLIFVFGLPVLIIGGTLLSKKAIKNLKEHITYPRTGYISYEDTTETGPTKWFVIGGALLLAILSLTGVVWLKTISIGIGLLLGLIFGSMAYRFHVMRFYAITVFAIIVGGVTSVVRVNDISGAGIVFGLTGLAVLITGSLTLISYLQHPKVETDEQS